MKKTGLFKIIMFILFAIVILTWIFPASIFDSGSLSEVGMYRIGFFDFFQLLFGAFEFQYFLQIIIFLLSVGALYGVLGKTGKYRAWIEKIANNLKGNEFVFLIVVAVVLTVITSIFDYGFLPFIFIPFLISIILTMGYDKVTACLVTLGSIMIGTMGSTIGYNMAGVVSEILETDVKTGLYFKIGILVLSLIALIFYLSKVKRRSIKKTEETKELAEEDMFIGDKISNKYSVTSIIVVFGLLFVLLVLGCTNWQLTFGITAFTELNTKITEFTIGDFQIFKYLLGTVNALGNWHYAEMAVMCLLATLLLGRLYRMKHRDMFEYMINGAKKMLIPAGTVVFAYTVIYFAGNTMFFPTIAQHIIGLTDKFNAFLSTITMFLGSILHVDMLYVANYVIPQLAAQDVSVTAMTILTQGIYGATMFIAPTSATLVLGLSYLGIPYKEWIAKTWKLAATFFLIVIVALFVALLIA